MDVENYPAMFRTYVARGLRAVMDGFDADAEQLDETTRDRGLHLLSYGLRLDEAWEDARDLALTLAPHLERQGYRHAWIETLEQAQRQAEAQGDDRGAAQIHVQLGRLHFLLGDYATAEVHLLRAQQFAAAAGDHHIQALALERLGHCAFERYDLDAAQMHARASLSLVAPDSTIAASNELLIALVMLRQGAFDQSIEQFHKVLAISQAHGQRQQAASAFRHLGLAYLYTERYDLAVDVLLEAVRIFGETQDIYAEAATRMYLGIAHWYRGEYAEALAAYAPCEVIFQQVAGRMNLARLYNNQGLVYREMGEFERACACFDKSIELARSEYDYLETANVLDSLAGLRLRAGDAVGAITAWQEALAELAHLPETPLYLHSVIRERMQAAQQSLQAAGSPAPGNQPPSLDSN